jgi:hypothetical protein
LYSTNSHFILNISTMARFKPVGKKRTKAKAPAKQGQDERRSHCQVVAAAAAAAAPADDAIVPPAGSLGTNAPSGIVAPSATAATTAVIAAATSSVAGANMPDFATATCSAAAGVPLPKKGSSKPRILQKDPFHLLLKPQRSPLPPPLPLPMLVTLHPSLLMLLPL